MENPSISAVKLASSIIENTLKTVQGQIKGLVGQPVSTQLSSDSQLERYVRMSQANLDLLRTRVGDAEFVRYTNAMNEIARRSRG